MAREGNPPEELMRTIPAFAGDLHPVRVAEPGVLERPLAVVEVVINQYYIERGFRQGFMGGGERRDDGDRVSGEVVPDGEVGETAVVFDPQDVHGSGWSGCQIGSQGCQGCQGCQRFSDPPLATLPENRNTAGTPPERIVY